MKKNITYIISDINKALAFEWVAEHINHYKIELNFILLNPKHETDLAIFLKKNNFKFKSIRFSGKKDIPLAIIKTILFLIKQKTTVVHTHLFNATIVGLLAAKICGIKKRIYTRHHSTYHHQYFPKAVKYDKFCNFLATDIIAITEAVKQLLIQREQVPENKVTVIHHGFKLNLFKKGTSSSAISDLKEKYKTKNSYPVIGVISRYTEWKGVQYIIPAFKSLLTTYPNAKLILANADGNFKQQIKNLLNGLPANNYVEISFEKDVYNLYHLFDVFIHVPIDNHSEAFGQTYIEALAAGIPSVFTLSGIANDFIKDKHNALVVAYKSSNAIEEAIKTIIESKDLRSQLIFNGKKDINSSFNLCNMILSLEKLYLS